MKRNIKFGFIALAISVFLFVLGYVITTNYSFISFLKETNNGFGIVISILSTLCLFVGAIGSLVFTIVVITIVLYEIYNKKIDKYDFECKEKVESELPKSMEFDVDISNLNDKELKQLLLDNLKCTAFFDGNSVYLKLRLHENVNIKTDDLLWFINNFKY